MIPRRCGLLVFIALAGAFAVQAQSRAAVIFINAASPQVTLNDISQLTAIAYDGQGNVIPNAKFTWSSTTPSVMTVDQTGVAQGNYVGWTDIYADYPGARGTIRLQVVPLKIVVRPANQTIRAGDTIQFAADALDVNGQPAAGVPILWRAYSANAGTNNGISIDTNGFASTYGWGTFFIEAYLNYTVGTGPFLQRVVGTTLLTVAESTSYQAVKLLDSSPVRQGFQLRERRGQIAVNDSGQIAYTGFLEGFAPASLLWKQGSLTPLAVAGVPAELPGSNLLDIGQPAINNNGEVAATCIMAAPRGCLLFAGADGVGHQIQFDGAGGSGVVNMRNFMLTRFSLNDTSQILFRADYYNSGSTVTQTGLFVTNPAGQISMAVAAGTNLPSFGTTYTFDADFGLANDGTILFFATNGASGGANRALFRMTPDFAIARVVGTNDLVAGSKILAMTNVVVGKNGQYAVQANNGSQNILLYAGDPSKYATLPVTSYNQIFSISGNGEAVFWCNLAQGYGLYRWDGSTVKPVLMQQTPSPSGDLYTQFDSAAITAKGEVIVQARTGNNLLLVLNAGSIYGAKQSILFQTGTMVNAPGGPSFYYLVMNGHSGNPMIKTGWYSWNVFEMANSEMVPRLITGDRTPDGWYFEGVYDARRNGNGDLIAVTDQSMSLIGQSKTTLLAHFPQRFSNGSLLYAPYQFAANGQGLAAGVGSTSMGVSYIFLSNSGTFTRIAWLGSAGGFQTNAPGGGYFSSSSDIGLTEDGTVYAWLHVAGGADGIFVWNGSAWVSVLQVGGAYDYKSVTSINSIRVAGNTCFASITSTGGVVHLARFQNGQWTDILSNGDLLPGGGIISGFGSWDVNRNGMLAAIVYAQNTIYVATTDGITVRIAIDTSHTLSTGELLPNLFTTSIHDDGRIFLTAINQQDQMVLYELDPQF